MRLKWFGHATAKVWDIETRYMYDTILAANNKGAIRLLKCFRCCKFFVCFFINFLMAMHVQVPSSCGSYSA